MEGAFNVGEIICDTEKVRKSEVDVSVAVNKRVFLCHDKGASRFCVRARPTTQA